MNVRFGAFEVDLEGHRLLKRGMPITLREQSFQVLAALVERPGEIVTREELRQRLWSPDTFVDFEVALNSAVSRLRDALGDSANSPGVIETIPKRGYRFLGSVETVVSVDPEVSYRITARWQLAAAAIVLAVLAVGLSWAFRSSASCPRRSTGWRSWSSRSASTSSVVVRCQAGLCGRSSSTEIRLESAPTSFAAQIVHGAGIRR